MEEKTLFRGRPSHWVYFTQYTISIVLGFFTFGITFLYTIYRFLYVTLWKIEITDQRIIEETGILSKKTNELELYRVKDIKLLQPFFLRIVGLSNILLETSDRTHPFKQILGVKNGKLLREDLRRCVDKRRDEKGVRETDFR